MFIYIIIVLGSYLSFSSFGVFIFLSLIVMGYRQHFGKKHAKQKNNKLSIWTAYYFFVIGSYFSSINRWSSSVS
ncbi:hypothetical protein COD89_29830 [Bacillus thuringiensis]|nr:hypothetical protein CON12_27470 [Bacillus thuringiensis]PGV51307.1 hypothetical protein COD89_29830 [Bacillus thuringiensis]